MLKTNQPLNSSTNDGEQLKMLDCGLLACEMEGMATIRVIATVITENVPMMVVQVAYPHPASSRLCPLP